MAVTLGDPDGDDLADIGVEGTLLRLTTLLGSESGEFVSLGETDFQLSKLSAPEGIESADLDGNGTLDLIIAHNQVYVLLGNGNGTFAAAQTFGTGDPESLVIRDFNGDNRLDIATANPNDNTVRVLVRDEGATFGFQEHSFPVGDDPHTIIANDFNADGIVDIATVNKAGSSVSILLGDSTGSFAAAHTVPVPGNPTSVISGDFNLDGFPDLVTNHTDLSLLTLMLGDGTGQFGPPVTLTIDGSQTSGFITGLATADVNGDGLSDIIASQLDLVHVLFQERGGAFSQLSFLSGGGAVSEGANFVLAADTDNDAAVDLVFVEGFSARLSILTNTVTAGRQWTYDVTFSQRTSFTDELGRETLYELDPATGNALKITRVVGQLDATSGETDDYIMRRTYTARGLVETEVDPLGRLSEYAYDQLGRMISMTVAKGTTVEAITQFEYDTAGNTTAIIDANGHRTQFTYDALNRPTQTVRPDPDGAGPLASPTRAAVFDANGNLVSATDALNNTTEWRYDAMDRIVEVIDAQDHTMRYDYDSVGNRIRTIDELGHITQNRYDARTRLIETIDPDGGRTQFKYDPDNNPTSFVDPLGNESRFVYDARSRVIAEFDPLGAVAQFGYDAVNNLTSTTDRNGRATRFEYDDLDRVTGETWVAG